MASSEFITPGAWPLDEGWDLWTPDAETDLPIALPEDEDIERYRARSGRASGEG